MIGIYKIVNNINQKCYIGKSENIENRFKHHLNDLRKGCHYNKHLQRSFDRYGENNFTFELIEECSLNQLNDREIFWIAFYKRKFNLYNICKGGEGGRMPDSIIALNKEKISKANKGKAYTKHLGKENGMYGKHHSIETLQKISLNRKGKCLGKDNPNYGRPLSGLHKKHISEALKGKTDSEETKFKKSLAAKKRAQDSKIYTQLCKNLTKNIKYSKSFTIEVQNKFRQGRSVRSLSKEYGLPYESTRQLVIRNIKEYYKNQEVNV